MPRWAKALVDGWDVGSLWIWVSGSPFAVNSGGTTGRGTTGRSTANTCADYTGWRNIGRVATGNDGIGSGQL